MTHTHTFGATPNEWNHFDLILELTRDLLPVVSDPNVQISPDSKMQGIGKTPSIVNRQGYAAGLTGWTSRETTFDDIDKWSKDGRLGICIQTRHVRAIDVDVGDFAESMEIEEFIMEQIGVVLPARRRSNSSKFLLAFRMDGEHQKSRFKTKTEGNFVEFLANGQQFIAVGTHTSGGRYEWDGTLPTDIPTLTPDQFYGLWEALVAKFGSEDAVTVKQGIKPSVKRRLEDSNDPMVEYLGEHWEVFGVSKDGRVDIRCPFADGHTDGISEGSSTSYYPAGVGGFQKGHFKCQHTSCAHRTDQDFIEGVGYATKGFDVLVPEVLTDKSTGVAVAKVGAPASVLQYVYQDGKKMGMVQPKKNAIYEALIHPEYTGYGIAYDRFRDAIMITTTKVTKPIMDGGFLTMQWRPMKDDDYYRLAIALEENSPAFDDVSFDTLRRAVDLAAGHCSFDSLAVWVRDCKWDGVPRVNTFLRDFMGAEDTPYTRAVSRYYWSALAGRSLQPGIKADMVPIAVGKQGARKTTMIRTIAPTTEMFVEVDLTKSDADLARETRGKIVGELGEMKGFTQRMNEHIKSYISRQHEEWTPKFKEFSTQYLRRVIFFGTTNDDEPLPNDSTGQRRYLPFKVKEGVTCSVEELAAVKEQLWAEAVVIFEAEGIAWQDAERLAPNEHKTYEKQDSWVDHIREYLFGEHMGDVKPIDKPGGLTLIDVITCAMSIAPKDITRQTELRVADCLRVIGMKKVNRNNRKVWVYQPA